MAMMTSDAFEVAVKIRSSESGNLYIIRMENAAIIRKMRSLKKIYKRIYAGVIHGSATPPHHP